jgi:hypothetical protein
VVAFHWLTVERISSWAQRLADWSRVPVVVWKQTGGLVENVDIFGAVDAPEPTFDYLTTFHPRGAK